MRNTLIAAAVATVLGSLSFGAHADTTGNIFKDGHVDGELRLYNFDRIYSTSAVPDAHALSGAVLLNAQTAEFGGGFSLGGSLVSANAFGQQASSISKIDTTLMGPDNSVSALSQAYVQYKADNVLVRAGQQYLNTPWMGSSDSRVLPAAYQAAMVDFKPAKGWDLIALRSFGWKGRTSDAFHFDNLYYPPTYRGDSSYGGIGGLPATARAARGAWAAGATYANGGFKGQGWYYDFIDFAHMGYVDGTYTFKTGTGFDPFIAAQYVDETGGSSTRLVENNVALFGVAGSKVKSRAWGTDVGVNIPHGKFEVAYNKIDQQAGAVGDGALISPYTAAYATDPLYTTSMIRGLVEQGPGHAWKTKLTYNLLNDKLNVMLAYAKYTTERRGNSHNVYVDLTYNLDGVLKGLSLRNRWERSTGGENGLNPGNGSFTYNRVMIAYKF